MAHAANDLIVFKAIPFAQPPSAIALAAAPTGQAVGGRPRSKSLRSQSRATRRGSAPCGRHFRGLPVHQRVASGRRRGQTVAGHGLDLRRRAGPRRHVALSCRVPRPSGDCRRHLQLSHWSARLFRAPRLGHREVPDDTAGQLRLYGHARGSDGCRKTSLRSAATRRT